MNQRRKHSCPGLSGCSREGEAPSAEARGNSSLPCWQQAWKYHPNPSWFPRGHLIHPGRLRARSPRNHVQFVATHFSVSWHRNDKGRAGIIFVSATVGTDVLPEVDSSHVLM